MTTEPSEREEAPERLWIHTGAKVETKACGCGGDVEYVRADLAALWMRERCVDRVKEMGQRWQDQRLREKRDLMEHAAMMCGAKAEAAYEITRVLESLTLEKEQ